MIAIFIKYQSHLVYKKIDKLTFAICTKKSD